MLNIVSQDVINKGWSDDRKYLLTAENGERYFMRLSDISKSEKRKKIFDIRKQLYSLGLPTSLPLEYRTEGGTVCTIEEWIDGSDAEEIIPALSENRQYLYGMESGKLLKIIHSIPAPVDIIDWETRFNAKIDRKIKMYDDCPIKFEGAENIKRYLSENRYLLKNRLQCFQHGDYHIGNMMLKKSSGRLIIIDFDRYDFGDPWEEFNRIVWCAQVSPLFASGMVNGYFDNQVPKKFWKLLAFYISSNMLSSIPWAVPFGEKEISTMLSQAKDVLSWYDGMRSVIPGWYHSSENKYGTD